MVYSCVGQSGTIIVLGKFKKKKKKKIWMDLVHNGGGGFGPCPLFMFFLLLM